MMYVNRRGDIFSEGPVGNKSFDEDTFEVDTLMTPIIAELIKKGYTTNACCSGGICNALVFNFDECIEDTSIEYIIDRGGMVDSPSIDFDDDVEPPVEGLPYQWFWELIIMYPSFSEYKHDYKSRSQITIFESEDGEQTSVETLMIEPRDKEKYPDFDKGKPIKAFRILPNMDYFNKLNHPNYNQYQEYYAERPYEYYDILVKALHDLYLWAKNLPEAKREE